MSSPHETTEADCTQLRESGTLVIPGVLSPAEVRSLREALGPVLGGDRFGRNPFEGERTERIYALLAKCPEVAPLVEHPRTVAIADAFLAQPWLLSTIQAINIHPGEGAQVLHCDDDAGAPPRPRLPQGVSTVWALDDFTLENGATRVVPGSHLWDADRTAVPEDGVSVEMEAGSVLVYLGGVLHGGGEHRGEAPRLGVSIIYCQPWLRQFENQMAAVPPKVALRYSERIQKMLGYSLFGPMGTVDGRNPMSLIADERRS